MASETPARALGLENELGALRSALAADFWSCGKALEIEAVFVAGQRPLTRRGKDLLPRAPGSAGIAPILRWSHHETIGP